MWVTIIIKDENNKKIFEDFMIKVKSPKVLKTHILKNCDEVENTIFTETKTEDNYSEIKSYYIVTKDTFSITFENIIAIQKGKSSWDALQNFECSTKGYPYRQKNIELKAIKF